MKICRGQLIRVLRTANNMTQREFAEKLGISNSYLSEIESDARLPSLKMLYKISKLLNFSMDEFFEGREI